MSVNVLTISGRLAEKPILKKFPDGSMVANFRLAHKRYEKGKGGEGQQVTDWYACSMWDKDAEYFAGNAYKGQEVMVSGTLVLRTYFSESKKVEVISPEIKVQQFTLGQMAGTGGAASAAT